MRERGEKAHRIGGDGSARGLTRALFVAAWASGLWASALSGWSAAAAFVPAGPMGKARANHVGILLQDGRVLAIAGTPTNQDGVELYDPATGRWKETEALGAARDLFAAVLLRDGRVLVSGGMDDSGKSQVSCRIYNPVTDKWVNAADMNTARRDHTATLLPDGTVLVAGGIDDAGAVLATSELYDPATDSWVPTSGPMQFPRARHAAAAYRDGRVVVTGGVDAGLGPQPTTERYDPGTGVWTALADMLRPRAGHSATLLADGRVLAVGGEGEGTAEILSGTDWGLAAPPPGGVRALHTATLLPSGLVAILGGFDGSGATPSTAFYDPTKNEWTTGPNLDPKRHSHSATMMPDGRVLVAGGLEDGTLLDSTVLLDVDDPSWIAVPQLPAAPIDATATLLLDGRVLVAGGPGVSAGFLSNPAFSSWTPTSNTMSTTRIRHTATALVNGQVLVAGSAEGNGQSADLYDPPTDKWTATGDLLQPRSEHTATLLPCGEVLVAGGRSGGAPVDTAERYNPRSGQWRPAASLKARRAGHTATLLRDGRVLVTGGIDAAPLDSAEVYDPATDTWSLLSATMTRARDAHTATLLPRGLVLLTGGTGADTTAELFAPGADSFTSTGSPLYERDAGFTATLLPNGRVLVTGGLKYPSKAEVYDPVTGGWTGVPDDTLTPHARHVASLTADGRVLVAGNSVASSTSAEIYDVGRGENAGWRPILGAVTDPLVEGGALAATGTTFQGMGEASTGAGPRHSSTAYPLVQLRRLDDARVAWLPADPATAWKDDAFRSLPLGGFAPGPAIATVFTNGIPSVSKGVSVECPPAVIATQPVSQSFCAASPASLSVAVAPLCETYQWFKDGSPLAESPPFSGTRTPTLGMTTAQAGTYRVVVSVSCSSVTTPSADAVVTLDPALSSVTATLPTGSSVCSTCLGGTAVESHVGGGAVAQQWGYRTTSGGTVLPLVGRTGPSYTLNGADFPGPGSYFLVVTVTPACGSPLVSNEIPVTVTSGGDVLDVEFFTVTSRDGENVLEWVNPPGGSGTAVSVKYNEATTTCAPPTSEAAGTQVPGTPLVGPTPGARVRLVHDSLVNGTQYCYTVFYDAGGGYASGRSNSGRPFPTAGPVKWSFSSGVFSTAPPTVGGAGVIATNNAGVVHAMARGVAGGEWPAGWRPVLLGGAVQARSPVVPIPVGASNPVAFLGSQDGAIHAVDAAVGGAAAPPWPSPAILGPVVQAAPAGIFTAFGGAFDYVLGGTRDATGDNAFVALDPADGSEKGRFQPAADPGRMGIVSATASVDYATGRVYFASRQRSAGSARSLWCLQLGASPVFSLAWSRDDLGDIDSSPVLRGGRVYVGSSASGGTVYSIDAAAGNVDALNRRFNHGDGQVKGFIFPDRVSPTGDLVFATTNRLWVVQDDGSTLTPKYAGGILLGAGVAPSPVLYLAASGRAYAGGSDGRLYEVDVTGPAPVVKSVVLGDGAAVVGAPSYDLTNGLVHVGTAAGIFYAVAVPLP